MAVVATINLSEVSEFALVICSLGVTYGHIEKDTLTIIIWVFVMLAIMSGNLLPYNYRAYGWLMRVTGKWLGRDKQSHNEGKALEAAKDGDHTKDHSIVILGFHKVAAMLAQTIQRDSPEILQKIHVVDFNETTLAKLKLKGFSTAYGDISCPDVLEHAVHGDVRLVILSVPDNVLRGTNNQHLLKVARQVWPDCKVIANADNPRDVERLYSEGADYVLRMSNLCGDKIALLLREFTKDKPGTSKERGSFSSLRAKETTKTRLQSVISIV